MGRNYNRKEDYSPKFTRADDGCSIAPTCLKCPLPRCRYDLPLKMQQSAVTQERDSMIRKARAAGASAPQIAEAAGISDRTVYRVLKEVVA